MATNKNNNTTQVRRISAALMLAFAFTAICVHGRASRAVQLQPAPVVMTAEAFERPSRD